jgi:hypothetical protein
VPGRPAIQARFCRSSSILFFVVSNTLNALLSKAPLPRNASALSDAPERLTQLRIVGSCRLALVANVAAARGISVAPRALQPKAKMRERRIGKYGGFTGKKP